MGENVRMKADTFNDEDRELIPEILGDLIR